LVLRALGWRWLIKPVLILCVLSAAAELHFMLVYGVRMGKSIMASMLQTHPREALDLLNPRLLLPLPLLASSLPYGWRVSPSAFCHGGAHCWAMPC
jgi:glucan phosphoethanolaminetransferase (alkaline phosphatase superfamily)